MTGTALSKDEINGPEFQTRAWRIEPTAIVLAFNALHYGSLTYLGFQVTDDCEVSLNCQIVPRYWKSPAQTRDNATAS